MGSLEWQWGSFQLKSWSQCPPGKEGETLEGGGEGLGRFFWNSPADRRKFLPREGFLPLDKAWEHLEPSPDISLSIHHGVTSLPRCQASSRSCHPCRPCHCCCCCDTASATELLQGVMEWKGAGAAGASSGMSRVLPPPMDLQSCQCHGEVTPQPCHLSLVTSALSPQPCHLTPHGSTACAAPAASRGDISEEPAQGGVTGTCGLQGTTGALSPTAAAQGVSEGGIWPLGHLVMRGLEQSRVTQRR